jgi:hypothetical protein
MLLAPGEPLLRGREAFIEGYKERMKENIGGTHTNELIDFGVDSDTAYQVGSFAIADSDPLEKGKFVNVLKR